MWAVIQRSGSRLGAFISFAVHQSAAQSPKPNVTSAKMLKKITINQPKMCTNPTSCWFTSPETTVFQNQQSIISNVLSKGDVLWPAPEHFISSPVSKGICQSCQRTSLVGRRAGCVPLLGWWPVWQEDRLQNLKQAFTDNFSRCFDCCWYLLTW